MLEHIAIRNLALIEDIEIDFEPGFTVLSGETGAGKSIILGALNLLMGEKADGSLVRTGADEASISAIISVDTQNPLRSWLQEKGISLDDDTLVIRRAVKQSGRGSIYVQSIPMTRGDLSIISEMLFDMHGQHEHQSLLHADRQRIVLDSYGNCFHERDLYLTAFRKLEELHSEAVQLEESLSQATRETDYLSFVVEELQRAKLQPQEDALLEEEISVLSQYETIHDSLELVYDNLKGGTGEGALNSLALAVQSCKRAERADTSLHELSNRLESLYVEAQDIAETMRDRLSSMSFSQTKLDELQSRLAQIQRLKKKYGPALEDVLSFYETAQNKLSGSVTDDERLQELRKEISQQDSVVESCALQLRNKRHAAAKTLQEQIASRLKHLGMPHVVFSIEVTERARTIHGADHIDFWFSANLGEPKRSLKDIASGGELSRVMLAVKTVLAEADEVETLVFDEVDAGIGGAVAIAVGEQIAELSLSRQVIAITHLASIAAKAQRHLVVHKEVEQGRTYTRIHPVNGENRIHEIARMLSGKTDDERALAHARSLFQGKI
jgi:DNA repair protein RecN (Recombination protein N)